jgi:anti-sigma B factor antagonist
MNQLLGVRIERVAGDASVVELTGELDLSTVPRVESPLLEQLRARQGVVVDLTKLSFIDSSGISVLIRAFHASNGHKMHTVIAPDSQVERVFRIAAIDRALPMFFDRGEALTGLAGGRNGQQAA